MMKKKNHIIYDIQMHNFEIKWLSKLSFYYALALIKTKIL